MAGARRARSSALEGIPPQADPTTPQSGLTSQEKGAGTPQWNVSVAM